MSILLIFAKNQFFISLLCSSVFNFIDFYSYFVISSFYLLWYTCFHLVQFIFWFSLRIPLWHKDYVEICWFVSKCLDISYYLSAIDYILIPLESVQWRKDNARKHLKKNASFIIKPIRERNRGELTQLAKEYLQKSYK